MRFILENITVAKTAAKQLRNQYNPEIPLHDYHTVIAKMLGYVDWFELEKKTKKGNLAVSPYDEMIGQEEQQRRIQFQSKAFEEFMGAEPLEAYDHALALRLTAGDKTSDKLYLANADRNHFISINEGDAIRVMLHLSRRSRKVEQEQIDWASSSEDCYYDYLDIFNSKPENIRSIAYILDELVNNNDELLSGLRMAQSLKSILDRLISELPKGKNVKMSYQPYHHRVFLSAIILAKDIFDYVGDSASSRRLADYYHQIKGIMDRDDGAYHIPSIDAA